jgi:UDP-glucose 4-epimerase
MSFIARAMIGYAAIEVKETGIRPGEKMHESLISTLEAPYTFRQEVGGKFYYVITPMLPELYKEVLNPLAMPFSSDTGVLSQENTAELLKGAGLV